jgi:hypothetical protein
MRNRLFILPAIVATIAAAPVIASDCDHRAQRHLTVPMAGVASVKVIGSAGSLEVRGVRGMADIRASGVACASSSRGLEKTVLQASRKGSEIIIEAVLPESHGGIDFWFFEGEHSRLDFVVQLPDHLPVRVVDGSGPLEVRNLASLTVKDGSGPIVVQNIAGPVKITDGSGEMALSNIGGPVVISDGSGEIEIRDVRGDVVIEEDGSGSLDIRAVRGNVIVEADGSGGIAVKDVGGDFVVRRDGSGGVRHAGVHGKIRLPRDDE